MTQHRNKLFRDGDRWCSAAELERLEHEAELDGPEADARLLRAQIRCGKGIFKGKKGRLLGKAMLANLEEPKKRPKVLIGAVDHRGRRLKPARMWESAAREVVEQLLYPGILRIARSDATWTLSNPQRPFLMGQTHDEFRSNLKSAIEVTAIARQAQAFASLKRGGALDNALQAEKDMDNLFYWLRHQPLIKEHFRMTLPSTLSLPNGWFTTIIIYPRRLAS